MSYADRDGVIWMDGEKVQWRDANVHVLTHTLHYGVGAFEGIRAYETGRGTAIFRLEDHIRRLFDTAHILEMDVPYSMATIVNACVESVKDNELASAYIRPLVYYGSEGMGLHADNLSVHVSIASWFWGAYLGADALEKGIRIKTSSYTRHLVNSVMCRAKACGNYINSILALQEAARDGLAMCTRTRTRLVYALSPAAQRKLRRANIARSEGARTRDVRPALLICSDARAL